MSAGYYAGLRARVRVSEADRQAVAAELQAELTRHPADHRSCMVYVPLGRGAALWLRIKALQSKPALLVLVGRNSKSGAQALRLSDLQLARALVWPDDATVEVHLRPESDDPEDLTATLWGLQPVGGGA